jgi:tRNA A37 methylthiotransferase MiaB
MPSFSIHNFGCRATQADADAIEGALVSRGYHRLAAADDLANLVVLNTCTVTAAADAQTRDAIRKIHRANPLARIVVTGCYAQRAPEELASIPGVSWVVGNSHQAEIPRIVDEEFASMPAPAAQTPLPHGRFLSAFAPRLRSAFHRARSCENSYRKHFRGRQHFARRRHRAAKAIAPGPS